MMGASSDEDLGGPCAHKIRAWLDRVRGALNGNLLKA